MLTVAPKPAFARDHSAVARRASGTPRVALATALALLAASTLVPAVARAQAQGPTTSGGSLPYIAAGQSEEQVQQRKRARAEAEEKTRQDAARAAAEEKARQDAARAPAEPPPVAAAPPVATPAAPPVALKEQPKDAAPRQQAAREPTTKAARSESVRTGRPAEVAVTSEQPQPSVRIVRPRPATETPPGLAGGFPDPRNGARPQQPVPQTGVVVVRKPLFFGLFGPQVDVTERVVVLTPPAAIGGQPPRPTPAPKVASGQRRAADNCHYHAYPTAGTYAHRDIQCHWHQDAGDPSLRYVD
jgi:hypothetical protein